MDYEYELRTRAEVVATGRLTQEEPLAVGDRITVGTHHGIVSNLLPAIGGRPPRITVEIARYD